jgi:protein prenyltransferase alpha subunit repeat containing protein 1
MIAGKCSNMQQILEKESQLVKYLAEKSKMNYRAWYHRSWLVSYMPREQVLDELNKNRDWDGLHVADNSCFHYRTRLMLKILEESIPSSDDELRQMWKEELDWDEILLSRYTGREALWLHRRFLSFYWIKNFSIDIGLFVDKEVKLFLATSTYHDFSFEDQCTQAVCSATYILWLIKHTSEPIEVEFEKKLGTGVVVEVLKKACPEKNFVWDSLLVQ